MQNSPDGARTISGYAVFYNSLSDDLGGFTERVAPGAFVDALTPGADVLALRDHDTTILLGRTKSGTLTLTHDAVGLRFSCKLPSTTQAADLATSIERGDLDGVSFGFVTLEDKWTNSTDGGLIRTLLKVNLLEISPCSFPAYSTSTVSIRSCPADLQGLLRKDSTTSIPEDRNHGLNPDPAMLSQSERHRLQLRVELAKRR